MSTEVIEIIVAFILGMTVGAFLVYAIEYLIEVRKGRKNNDKL